MLPGVSFSPTGGVDQQGAGGQRSAAPNSPLQDAIKILSFRMPTTVGQGAPSPLANSELGGGQVQDWLMKLFQLMPQNKQPQAAPQQAASSYAPPPPPSAPASPFSPSSAPQTSYAPPQAPQIEGSAPPPDLSSIPSAPAPNVVFTPPGGRMAF